MKKKKGLVISWFYPPINSSESFVTFKLLSHSNIDYDIWTREAKKNNVWDRGIKEEELRSSNIRVLDISKDKSKNMKEWISAAVDYYLEHSDEYDFIMTRSMPPESHEIGKRIKEVNPSVKWIASLGDPLVGTPYLEVSDEENPYLLKRYIEKENPSRVRQIKIMLSPMRHAQKFVWKKERKAMGSEVDYSVINDYTLRGADMIIVNNDYQMRHVFSGKYERYMEKARVIPHTFDEKFYPKTAKKDGKKIRISYTGHLDSLRNAGILLRAVNRLMKFDNKLADKVEFSFYGHLADRDKLYIMDHRLYDVIKINGDVSYFESLRIMKQSDWMMVFDANFTNLVNENIYFPAKLADYIGAKSNILAITQIDGITADIVRSIGNGLVCTYSVDEVAMYLSKIIYQGYVAGKINESERMKYNADVVAREYDKAVGELLK